MIEYLISSLITNLGLFGFLYYKLMWYPKQYNKVIIINEKGGATQIKIEYCKVIKDNKLKIIGKKIELKLEEKEEDEEYNTYLDNKGKDLFIVRTTDGMLYSYVKYEKSLLKGLSKEKRIFFADLIESNDKEWSNDTSIGKFLKENSVLIICVLFVMAESIIFLKFAGEPSKQFIESFSEVIRTATNGFTDAAGTLATNTNSTPLI